MIPEEQAGFRNKKGTQDHLFTLSSIVNIHGGTSKKCAFIVFIDLKRAFDSVKHGILWDKLFHLGIIGKIIRVLRQMYNNAKLTVKSKDEYTRLMDVTEGVLQGDSLSPLLFILFISDIVLYFKENGMDGIALTHELEIIMLLFADDIVMFARSWHDAQNKLKILKNYCHLNGLNLNTSKTKVVPIRKTGKCKKFETSFLG